MKHMDTVREMAGDAEDRVDFIMRTLKNTDLPYLVVEGVPDESIYRRVRSKIYGELGCRLHDNDEPLVQILIAKGKPNVLKIYQRRAEFKDRAPVAFMVDQDDWMFYGIPKCYQVPDIICTTGYSIENDLYSDGKPDELILHHKVNEHTMELASAIQVWARKVAEMVASRHKTMDRLKLEEGYQQEIEEKPELKLQGKTLFDLLLPVCDAVDYFKLSEDVFSTIDWNESHPPLLSKLMWDIQKEITEKRAALRDRALIDLPSLKKRS